MIRDTVASLTDLKGAARRQIMRLGDESLQYGIKWMIKILKDALLRRKGKHSANISANNGTQVESKKPGGEQAATSAQVPASGDPGCKNCTNAAAGGAISLATGCESFDHTDFVLGAPCPSPGRAPTAAILPPSTRAASARAGSRPTARAWTLPSPPRAAARAR